MHAASCMQCKNTHMAHNFVASLKAHECGLQFRKTHEGTTHVQNMSLEASSAVAVGHPIEPRSERTHCVELRHRVSPVTARHGCATFVLLATSCNERTCGKYVKYVTVTCVFWNHACEQLKCNPRSIGA